MEYLQDPLAADLALLALVEHDLAGVGDDRDGLVAAAGDEAARLEDRDVEAGRDVVGDGVADGLADRTGGVLNALDDAVDDRVADRPGGVEDRAGEAADLEATLDRPD